MNAEDYPVHCVHCGDPMPEGMPPATCPMRGDGDSLPCVPDGATDIRPVGTDTDGNGIWTDGVDAWNSGEPLTPDEAAEAEARTAS